VGHKLGRDFTRIVEIGAAGRATLGEILPNEIGENASIVTTSLPIARPLSR
jgi:hypothetical protein